MAEANIEALAPGVAAVPLPGRIRRQKRPRRRVGPDEELRTRFFGCFYSLAGFVAIVYAVWCLVAWTHRFIFPLLVEVGEALGNNTPTGEVAIRSIERVEVVAEGMLSSVYAAEPESIPKEVIKEKEGNVAAYAWVVRKKQQLMSKKATKKATKKEL